MGAFEYFQLAEALGAEPLWVINNGISHTYSVPAENIWPLVQVLPPTLPPPNPFGTTTAPSPPLLHVQLWLCCLGFSTFFAMSWMWWPDLLVVLRICTRYTRLVHVDVRSTVCPWLYRWISR